MVAEASGSRAMTGKRERPRERRGERGALRASGTPGTPPSNIKCRINAGHDRPASTTAAAYVFSKRFLVPPLYDGSLSRRPLAVSLLIVRRLCQISFERCFRHSLFLFCQLLSFCSCLAFLRVRAFTLVLFLILLRSLSVSLSRSRERVFLYTHCIPQIDTFSYCRSCGRCV